MHLLLLFLVTLVSHVLACDPYNSTFINKKAKIFQLEDSSAKIKRTISGDVKVLDGCRFQITNFTIIPPALGVYFYAIPTVQPSEEEPQLLARIVTQGLGSYNGQTVPFYLKPDFSWDDFAVVTIHSEQDRKPYAAFGINRRVKDTFKVPAPKEADLSLDSINAESWSVSDFSFNLTLILSMVLCHVMKNL
jgi:hypothetical protein